MAGNELNVCRFLVMNLSSIRLSHLGRIDEIRDPDGGIISSQDEINKISTQSSRKKADIYINGKGVSIKQTGGSVAFNRLQRANIAGIFELLQFTGIDRLISKLDKAVNSFHLGHLDRRNRCWADFFLENQFRSLLEFLMMKGSPNVGLSNAPAEFILEAPHSEISLENINVYTFEEYFSKYKSQFKIALRRQWVGQKSNSEHNRALSLLKKAGNAPWIYHDVSGCPRTGWRVNFPAEQRKTVYFLMIEKEIH